MKLLIFLICVGVVLATEARPKDVSINQDVFVCGESVRALPLVEYEMIEQKKLTFPDHLQTAEVLNSWLKISLEKFSSARARLFEQLITNRDGRISYKKNIQSIILFL